MFYYLVRVDTAIAKITLQVSKISGFQIKNATFALKYLLNTNNNVERLQDIKIYIIEIQKKMPIKLIIEIQTDFTLKMA